MSLFKINKIIAVLILTIVVLYAINKIGNYLINPTIPEEQAYKIDIPQDTDMVSVNEDVKDSIEPISLLLLSASLESGEKIASKCSSCHSFDKEGKHKIGPNLYDIINSPIGKKDGYAYSSVMSGFGGNWTYENIAAFLYKPKDYMDGTKMNFAGLKKVEDRANLILWLRENSDNPVPLP